MATIIVLKNVDRLEFMPLTPIFPKIAVRPAKKAEPTAKYTQVSNIKTSNKNTRAKAGYF